MVTLLSPRLVSLYPRIDLKSPVLYAPLWRNDMVARGGRIENGTGVLTGHPLHLAVGANTVAVTGLGTFTVYMPEGGTVASDTTTVTASPVTVSAGIATTVTTTGATGNITVTSSNIIRSKDKTNHAMTITGTTKVLQGRECDGDDKITTPTRTWGFSTSGTMAAWVKTTDTVAAVVSLAHGTNANEMLLYVGVVANKISILQQNVTGNYWTRASDTSVNDNKWHFVVGQLTGASETANKIFFDGVEEAGTTASAGTPAAIVDTTARGVSIGQRWGTSAASEYYSGTIGEVWIYSRLLTVSEIQQIYLATRWRYS